MKVVVREDASPEYLEMADGVIASGDYDIESYHLIGDTARLQLHSITFGDFEVEVVPGDCQVLWDVLKLLSHGEAHIPVQLLIQNELWMKHLFHQTYTKLV